MWQDLLSNIILSVVGVIITFVGSLIIKLINTKIKDEKLRSLLNDAWNVVTDGVDFVYQTYVQGIKGTNLWDETAMKEANAKAVEYIKDNLPKEIRKYLDDNGKDMEEWIKEQIEVAIKKSKDKKK